MDSPTRHPSPGHLPPQLSPLHWETAANDTDESVTIEPAPASREVPRLTPADERLAAELLQSFVTRMLAGG